MKKVRLTAAQTMALGLMADHSDTWSEEEDALLERAWDAPGGITLDEDEVVTAGAIIEVWLGSMEDWYGPEDYTRTERTLLDKISDN